MKRKVRSQDEECDKEEDEQLQKRGNLTIRMLQMLQQEHHPSTVSCRDNEKEFLRKFIVEGIRNKGCRQMLYISGMCGIGKTLCVNEVTNKLKVEYPNVKYVCVNALRLKKANEIYRKILYEITNQNRQLEAAIFPLQERFMEKQKGDGPRPYEVDCLMTRDNGVLYSVSEWSQSQWSRLIVVGISNTLDFRELLPEKISSRMGSVRLDFAPYSASQINQIVSERVEGMGVFSPATIDFICKKITHCSSDIRRVLFVLREAITQHFFADPSGTLDITTTDLLQVYNSMMTSNLNAIFPELSFSYKYFLFVLAKYFKNQVDSLTYRQFEDKLASCRLPPEQSTAILYSLRDMGFIHVYFNCKIVDRRNNRTLPQIIRNHQEEHITFKIQSERILYCISQDPQFVQLQRSIAQ